MPVSMVRGGASSSKQSGLARVAEIAEKYGDFADGHDAEECASEIIATILAALQEPTGEMCKAGRNETIGVGHFYASDIWRAMFAASPPGEQSE
ncbi:MAG: hypothetical protein ACTHLK_12460 [Brucella intermedia]